MRFGVRRGLPSAGRAVLTQLRGLVQRGDGSLLGCVFPGGGAAAGVGFYPGLGACCCCFVREDMALGRVVSAHRCSGRQVVDGVRASSHPVGKRRALAALARSAVLDSTPRKSSASPSVAVLTSFVVLPQALSRQDNSCSYLISLPHSRFISLSHFSLSFLPLDSLPFISLLPAHPSGQASLRHLSTCLALAVPFAYNL